MGRVMKEQNGHVKHSETNGHVDEFQFVERVKSIPIIKDSVSTAQSIAEKTKIGRFALSTANSTIQYAVQNQPKYIQSYYATYLQPQVEKVDALGCKSLDMIQSKVPIINKPSSEIIQSFTKPPIDMMDGVKIKVDSILSDSIQQVNQKFSVVVDGLEGVVDKYLPPNQQLTNGAAFDQDNQIKRAYGILSGASARLTEKINHQDFLNIQELNSKLKFFQETVNKSIVVYGSVTQERLTVMMDNILQQINHLIDLQPDWIKNNPLIQQLNQIKIDLLRSDLNYKDKLKVISNHIQNQINPLLEQLNSYLYLPYTHQNIKTE